MAGNGWIFFPSFLSTSTVAADEAASATQVQAAWRRHKEQRRLVGARAAAVKIQRAARAAPWDPWAQWDRPLSTMPGLVLERVGPNKMSWESATASARCHQYRSSCSTRLQALLMASLVVLFVLATLGLAGHTADANRPKSTSTDDRVPSSALRWAERLPATIDIPTQPRLVVTPVWKADVSLLSGWVGSNDSSSLKPAPAPDDSWFSPRATASAQGGATIAMIGTRSKASVVRAVLLAPLLQNVTGAIVQSGAAFIEHLRDILKALLKKSGQLKRFLLDGFR